MIIGKEFYDRCCPSYKKVIDKFEKEIANIKAQKEDEEVKSRKTYSTFLNFYRCYLTPNEYWKFVYEYLSDNIEWNDIFYKVARRAFFHFYHDEEWNSELFDYESIMADYGDKYLKLMDYPYNYSFGHKSQRVTEQDLEYPHNYLKKCFRCLERNSTRILPTKTIKRYNEMATLYQNIKAAENDGIEKWFNILLEAKSISFVKHNVEYRLGKNFFDIKLWKLYLSFLKKIKAYKSLLETYSKYCRFFLDDVEILEMYKADTIAYGPIRLPWINLFNFEVVKENEGERTVGNCTPSVMEEKEILPLNKNLCFTFFETCQLQNFDFRTPLILYILQNANHRTLRKLFSLCNYFYSKMQTPICYRLFFFFYEDDFEAIFKNEQLFLKNLANKSIIAKNTYITGIIDFQSNLFMDGSMDTNKCFLSEIIPRFYRCEAKYNSQNLSYNNLKFLIQHGGVVNLNLSNSELKNKNGNYVALEMIIKYLPNIEELKLPAVKSTSNTGHALANQIFTGKISTIFIESISGEPFDADEFLKFFKTNRDEKYFSLHLFIDPSLGVNFVEKLGKIMKDYMKICESEDTKIEIWTRFFNNDEISVINILSL